MDEIMAKGIMDKKEESWFSTGSKFGISKKRQMEIFEDVKNKMKESGKVEDVEQYVSETYIEAGESYVAGFGFCYYLIVRRMQDNVAVRKLFWEFLLGITPVVNPFDQPFPIQLIEVVGLGKDVTKGMRIALEEYDEFMKKKKREPEVA